MKNIFKKLNRKHAAYLSVGALVVATLAAIIPSKPVVEARCKAGAFLTESRSGQAIDDSQLQGKSAIPADTQANYLPVDKIGKNLILNSTLESVDQGNLPMGWNHNIYGENEATFSLVEGHNSAQAVKVQISKYKSGDANWYYQPVSAQEGYYQYQDYYKSNVPTKAVLMYKDSSGEAHYINLAATGASADWKLYQARFFLPQGVQVVQVYHVITAPGYLITDNYSLSTVASKGFNSGMVTLTFDDGWSSIAESGLPLLQKYNLPSTQYLVSGYIGTKDYVSADQVYDLASSGHQIASHSMSHADLSQASESTKDYELRMSKKDLTKCFGETDSYASPYGRFDHQTLELVKKHFKNHRSTEAGFNSRDNLDPYNLLVQNVSRDTKPSEIADWIETAKKHKLWLILVYHQVDNGSSEYGRSPELLESDFSQIKKSGLTVKTVEQALGEIDSQNK